MRNVARCVNGWRSSCAGNRRSERVRWSASRLTRSRHWRMDDRSSTSRRTLWNDCRISFPAEGIGDRTASYCLARSSTCAPGSAALWTRW